MRQNLTVDHVVPLSKGGKWAWENLVTACTRCNGEKARPQPHPRACNNLLAPAHICLGLSVLGLAKCECSEWTTGCPSTSRLLDRSWLACLGPCSAVCLTCSCPAALSPRCVALQGDKSLKQLGWRLAAKPVVRS